MKTANGRVKSCRLLAHETADNQAVSVAALFQVATGLLDKNRFQMDNIGVVGRTPQARLASQDSRFVAEPCTTLRVLKATDAS